MIDKHINKWDQLHNLL